MPEKLHNFADDIFSTEISCVQCITLRMPGLLSVLGKKNYSESSPSFSQIPAWNTACHCFLLPFCLPVTDWTALMLLSVHCMSKQSVETWVTFPSILSS